MGRLLGGGGGAFAALARSDRVDGGSRRIEGLVTVDGVPAARRVRLHDQPSGRLLREGWSGADGVYAFNYLRAGTFYVVGLDHTGQFDPEAKSDLASEPMP
jgi:hypothetical protein